MDKIKSLLLPLALVFAALAVFETGARYGATNMRAHAVAEQLDIFTQLKISVQSEEHGNQQVSIISAAQMDLLIARGALLRQVWYLGFRSNADDALDNALTQALNARGADNVIKSFELAKESADTDGSLTTQKITEIIAALTQTKTELIDNAPTVPVTDVAPPSTETVEAITAE